MANKYQDLIFKALDEILQRNPNKQLVFVDAFQEDDFLGASGAFVDCIPNAKAYHHVEFRRIVNECTDTIVVCCPLVNAKHEFDVYLQEGNTKTFFGAGNKPCIVLFVDIPYEEKPQLFISDMADIFCEYEKHLKEGK